MATAKPCSLRPRLPGYATQRPRGGTVEEEALHDRKQ